MPQGEVPDCSDDPKGRKEFCVKFYPPQYFLVIALYYLIAIACYSLQLLAYR